MAVVSEFLQNKMANAAVNADWTARAHVGNPGNNGAANRIAGSPTPVLAVASWSEAAAGDVNYTVALPFGVLDSGVDRDVSWLSLYEGGNWVGNVEVDPSVVVQTGGTFTVNAGTIRLNGMSA